MLDALIEMPIFSVAKTILAFVVALGILITVHEFGHFWVARLCGVKVLRFSIGFGKRLWGRVDRHGTEFVIAAIPLGGYVKMLDERVAEVPEQLRSQAFNNKTVGQRAAIVSAGPIANFLFAILAYWLIFILGVPGIRPVVDQVATDSIAQQAGLESGMRIESINGTETPDLNSLHLALINQQDKPEIVFGISRFDGYSFASIILNTQNWSFNSEKDDPVRSLGIKLVLPKPNLTLKSVEQNSVAGLAGLQAGDRIVTINGITLEDGYQFIDLIRNSANRELTLEVERQNSFKSINVTPRERVLRDGSIIGALGVLTDVKPLPEQMRIVLQYGPIDALYHAIIKTWQLITTITKELGHLFAGDRSLSGLGGPITIAQGAGASASSGLVGYIVFLALISVNLGIINLFPLPILDGGHLVFLGIEKVIGRPVSEKVQEYSYRFGAILLIMLMGLTFFNDVTHLFNE